MAAIIGLIGAVLILASLALSWVSLSAQGISVDMTGFTFVTGSITVLGQTANFGTSIEAVLVLVGGILALVGALGLYAGKRMVGFLAPIGGLLALIGGAWTYAQAAGQLTAAMPAGVSAGIGIGVYLAIVGGIVAMILTLGLMKEPKK